MRIEYDFDIVGGEFDGAPMLRAWIDDGKHPVPDLIFVGVCGRGRDCGSSKCSTRVAHVSYWTPEEADRPVKAQPYPKQTEYVRTDAESGEMAGRAVYAIGGLSDPRNFGEAAREPAGADRGLFAPEEPLVTALGGDIREPVPSGYRTPAEQEAIRLDGVTVFRMSFHTKVEPIDVPPPVRPVERSGSIRVESVDRGFEARLREYAVRSQLGEFRP